jgi:23S rRNA (cytosine1962-C5)-methyltransferase
MSYLKNRTTRAWEDYELLDSGDNMKLERFGTIIVARPETQALWRKQKPELWKEAHAEFAFRDKKGGWTVKKPVPDSWELGWGTARFTAQLTGFKHTGVFPEQVPNWEWTKDQIAALKRAQKLPDARRGISGEGDVLKRTANEPDGTHNAADGTSENASPKVLNLFGYTGIASVVAAQAGAQVTHVDASKQSLDWAHDNARRSGLPEDAIRWILDDALAFVKREARRGASYDGIILDPPAFGRGAKGEVWKIEEDFPVLLEELKKILSDAPGSFFLVNGYAAGYAPRSFAQDIESAFGPMEKSEEGELYIQESDSERVIPAGIYVRFVR